MRVSFTFEVTGGPGLPSASLLGGRIQRDKLFSIYRFVTLALVMGLSIALIPLSITQREHMYGRWYRSERARLSYVCGLSVTSLLFTLVAYVMPAFHDLRHLLLIIKSPQGHVGLRLFSYLRPSLG